MASRWIARFALRLPSVGSTCATAARNGGRGTGTVVGRSGKGMDGPGRGDGLILRPLDGRAVAGVKADGGRGGGQAKCRVRSPKSGGSDLDARPVMSKIVARTLGASRANPDRDVP